MPSPATGSSSHARSRTSLTLLARVRKGEAESWSRLVRVYGPLIGYWCLRAGLSNEDSADVTQIAFANVARGIGRFERDADSGTFRGWLLTITRNAIRNYVRERSKSPQAAGGSEHANQLAELADPLSEDELTGGSTARRLVLHHAVREVRGEVNEQSWQAFWQTAVQQFSSREAAERLGMTPTAVRMAKSRVLRRLRDALLEPLEALCGGESMLHPRVLEEEGSPAPGKAAGKDPGKAPGEETDPEPREPLN